jgi:hypothetical protein
VTGETTKESPYEAVAGMLAALAIFASLVAWAYKPARLAPAAFVLALIAVGMGGRHQRLAAFAVAAAAIGWVVGMAVAVITERPIF